MKRFLGGALAAASLMLTAQGLAAQATGFVSAGASLPMGDFKDAVEAKTGWLAQAGVSFPVGPAGLSVGVGGFFGVNNHEFDGDKTNLYGAAPFVLYNIGASGSLQPYVFGGPAYLVHSYKSETFPEGSNSGLGADVGAGLNIPVGGTTAYVEGMYLTGISDDVDGTDVAVISAGVNIPLG